VTSSDQNDDATGDMNNREQSNSANNDTVDHTSVKVTSSSSNQAGHDTHIRTISSETSFLTGSPLVRSPAGIENQGQVFQFNPSMAPGMSAFPFPLYSTAGMAVPPLSSSNPAYTDPTQRDTVYDVNAHIAAAQYQQLHYPFTHFASPIRPSHIPPMFLSPYCASPTFPPPPSPQNPAGARIDNRCTQSSQSNSVTGTPRGSLQPTNENHSQGSPNHTYNNASHDTLIKEITRLRERLKTVESENSLMAAKLNQQQWELEHRLSELEMHMTCTSDLASSGSTDDLRSNPFENISRESMI